MPSDATRPSASPRRFRKVLLFTLSLIALCLVSIAWLFGTASGARTAFAAIKSFSGGMLHAQGVAGRLSGPLSLESLTLEQPDNHVVLRNLRLDWRPSALLHRTLHLTSLHIEHVGITTKAESAKETPTLPEQIALPFALQVDEGQFDGGELRRGEVPLLRLGPLVFRFDFDGNRYRLDLQRFTAGSSLEGGNVTAEFSGQASLSAAKPYGVRGKFSSTTTAMLEQRGLAASGNIELRGSLADLALDANLGIGQARVNIQAMLRPFSGHPLGRVQGAIEALDLAAFDPKLPHTALDILLNSTDQGSGELRIRNTAAGTYDDSKLPLHGLTLAFRQKDGQLLFEQIVARLGTTKLPAGEISGQGRHANGALTLALHTDALDLRRIDGRVRATLGAG